MKMTLLAKLRLFTLLVVGACKLAYGDLAKMEVVVVDSLEFDAQHDVVEVVAELAVDAVGEFLVDEFGELVGGALLVVLRDDAQAVERLVLKELDLGT